MILCCILFCAILAPIVQTSQDSFTNMSENVRFDEFAKRKNMVLPGTNKTEHETCISKGAIGYFAEEQFNLGRCDLICTFKVPNGTLNQTENRLVSVEDGYKCGEFYHCLSGECVPEHIMEIGGNRTIHPLLLHGEKMTLEDNCINRGAEANFSVNVKDCKVMCRYKVSYPNNSFKDFSTPLLNGYTCNDGAGHCINATCVSKQDTHAEKVRISVDQSLPGKFLSPDVQCRWADALAASVRNASVCHIACIYIDNDYKLEWGEIQAEDGYPCSSKNSHCINGKCIHQEVEKSNPQGSTNMIIKSTPRPVSTKNLGKKDTKTTTTTTTRVPIYETTTGITPGDYQITSTPILPNRITESPVIRNCTSKGAAIGEILVASGLKDDCRLMCFFVPEKSMIGRIDLQYADDGYPCTDGADAAGYCSRGSCVVADGNRTEIPPRGMDQPI